MAFHHTLGGERHTFADLKALLAAASSRRSGDELAGLAATSDARRVAARYALADLPLSTFLATALVPYEEDEVTRLIVDTHDKAAFAPIAHMTVGGFRDWLLSHEADTQALRAIAPGVTPEMAAAASKLMRNQDLMSVAHKITVVTKFRNTIGLKGCLASRLQPNHPTDDLKGIAASTLDGLLYGMGDAVVGINPATDSVANGLALLDMLDHARQRYDIPTQTCVLTHVTNTIEIINRGGAVDLVFQSIAGTQKANEGFGVSLAILKEAREAALSLGRGTLGTDLMYFETGQGAALSADAHHGIDQQTVEARAYAVAREFHPLLVNTVVGFIGPEYLYDGKQIIRAGLEDHFCAKLMGVPMGCDVCYTNHAEADQDDMDNLMVLLGTAGITFLIGVPGADDIMLNYQSLSFHDILTVRNLLGLKPAPEFAAWLERMGLYDTHRERMLPVSPGQTLLGQMIA
ncbi:ethanolamine ammonia lyase large subunit [Acetobacter estunensis NRIC 0472]|uniref:Ethanolamine ammonia-lyase large subunit n=1 Tax=Acetobacter estunensis TaxID=104097 RepID=A0A967BDC4_9PROT|nr:ethanolamine ammonia-lyase subunit EutB [Acetobacter estunensis]NHO54963.1 ethanolamine ammonia-lyase subunit EutB [Acetobacter estunensis]GBQ25373.1 ethanolamine ammonia lyase large subunit [Acetobacter estunensis NRIC 0472]